MKTVIIGKLKRKYRNLYNDSRKERKMCKTFRNISGLLKKVDWTNVFLISKLK